MSPRPPDILRKSHRHAERNARTDAKDRLREDLAAAGECYAGRCRCGALGFRYCTDLPPAQWSLRVCDCERCRRGGAVYASDPAGWVELLGAVPDDAAAASGPARAGLAICARCGDLVAAVLRAGESRYASVNVRRLDEPPSDLPAAAHTNLHDGESGGRARGRGAEWTPLRG